MTTDHPCADAHCPLRGSLDPDHAVHHPTPEAKYPITRSDDYAGFVMNNKYYGTLKAAEHGRAQEFADDRRLLVIGAAPGPIETESPPCKAFTSGVPLSGMRAGKTRLAMELFANEMHPYSPRDAYSFASIAAGTTTISASDSDCEGCEFCADADGDRIFERDASMEEIVARLLTPEAELPKCVPTLTFCLSEAINLHVDYDTASLDLAGGNFAGDSPTATMESVNGRLGDALDALANLDPDVLCRLLQIRFSFGPDFFAIIPTAVSLGSSVEFELVFTSEGFVIGDVVELRREIEALATPFRRLDGALVERRVQVHGSTNSLYTVEVPTDAATAGPCFIETPPRASGISALPARRGPIERHVHPERSSQVDDPTEY